MDKILIVLLSYNRIDYLKFILPDYLAVCQKLNYDLVVSLDGSDPQYIGFCKVNNIPLLYSEKREGVGISKNRVLMQFPNYDHYFFIEDDAELCNLGYFSEQIKIAEKTKIPHFSLHEINRLLKITEKIRQDKYTILCALYGGAPVSYFTKEGLSKVGGWHDIFAPLKRCGHTEHSWRYYNQKLSPAPFCFVCEFEGFFRWHNPPSLVNLKQPVTINFMIKVEQDLIDSKLTYYPVKTNEAYKYISPYGTCLFPKYKTSTAVVKKLIKNFWLTIEEKHRILNTYYLFKFGEKAYNYNCLLVSILSKCSIGYKILKIKHFIVNSFWIMRGKGIKFF